MIKTMPIDKIDEKILKTLLQNARTKMSDIARDCNVSITTIKNRMENLRKEGIILKEEMLLDMSCFGYEHVISMGINLAPEQEKNVFDVIKEKMKLIVSYRLVGTYDLYFMGYVKTLEDLYNMKEEIQKHKDVNDVEILLWNKMHFHFGNIQLTTTEE
jgi:DNA-binding Lrp family transcriptional regulator